MWDRTGVWGGGVRGPGGAGSGRVRARLREGRVGRAAESCAPVARPRVR
ncbi:hypothetical protein SMICM17S_07403 [Streptomyces microflavus]